MHPGTGSRSSKDPRHSAEISEVLSGRFGNGHLEVTKKGEVSESQKKVKTGQAVTTGKGYKNPLWVNIYVIYRNLNGNIGFIWAVLALKNLMWFFRLRGPVAFSIMRSLGDATKTCHPGWFWVPIFFFFRRILTEATIIFNFKSKV